MDISAGSLDATKNVQPVRFLESDDPSKAPRPGIGLCLSGGGYRAMLFHLGAIWRLNELGLLRKNIVVAGAEAIGPQHLVRVSSVSGGSITAGTLALNWNSLTFDAANVATNLGAMVVEPIRAMASTTIDVSAILKGKLLPLEECRWRNRGGVPQAPFPQCDVAGSARGQRGTPICHQRDQSAIEGSLALQQTVHGRLSSRLD